MVDINSLIFALRCSATPKSEMPCKQECPYFNLEPHDPTFPVPPDFDENGVKYHSFCDCDAINLDAANILEVLHEQLDIFRTEFSVIYGYVADRQKQIKIIKESENEK